MSSVFEEYEQLLASQIKPSGSQGLGDKGGTLRVEIPVFTLNSDDQEDRWHFAVFCLRVAVSEDANKPLRQGALISLLCAHSQVMRTHVALAGRQTEATMAILEIDSFSNGVPQFNNRSGVSDERTQRFMMIAGSLPRACSNGSPFTSSGAEDDVPEDITETLERILSIQVQIWVTVAKAMTAYETADESETRRINKYMQQGRVQKRYIMHPVCRSAIQMIIRQSLPVRTFLVSELKRGRNTAGGTSTYYNFVGDIDAYIRNTGLTAFFLTLKYGINTKTSALALSSLSGDIQKMKQLMRLYRAKGDNAAYMTLLGDSDQMNFAPAEYACLYSFAMGMASIIDKGTTRYQFARDFMNTSFWRLGVEYAQAQGNSIDESMAAELKLTPAARRGLAATAQKVSEESGSAEMPMQSAGVLTGISQTADRSDQPKGQSTKVPRDANADDTQFLDLMRAVAAGMRDASQQNQGEPPSTGPPPPTPGGNQDQDQEWGY
ncbi:nucleoprotein [avian paramyxovirus 16]|uniref:Nucleocapsid n=1 Tax=avian paramyxovirus 16 TaxID=2560322 RepID=A0A1Z1G744_9MONO|nr:nucleoprotein [Avian paramyxovirus UPO216]ARV85975.1 nucleoprotein [Avian paramyxovirus UPO216]